MKSISLKLGCYRGYFGRWNVAFKEIMNDPEKTTLFYVLLPNILFMGESYDVGVAGDNLLFI